MKKMKITLFTSTTCPRCQSAKEALEKLKVKYEVVVIDADVESMSEFYYWSDMATVPTLLLQRPSELDTDTLDMSDYFLYEGFDKLPEALKKLAEWI